MSKPKSNFINRFVAYWRESLEKSQEVNDLILYVALLVSAGLALACALAGFNIPGLQLFSDPLMQKITTLVAILLFIWLLIWLPFRRHEIQQAEHDKKIGPLLEKLKPKFKLSCGKNIPACKVPNHNGNWIYFRMIVEADCADEIKNCVGHLIKIEKNGAIIYDHDVRQLPFSPAESPDCLDKTIFPNIPYTLDVLSIYTPNLRVYFATKGQPTAALNQNGIYIFNEDGDYILHVNVSGAGAGSVVTRLKFTLNAALAVTTIESA